MAEPVLLSAKEGAAFLGVPYTSLREAVFRGELPVVMNGRRWYFRRTELDKWVRNQEVRHPQP